MAFPDADVSNKKILILMEIGEHDGIGPVTKSIDALWNIEAPKGGDNLELAYLYVKRKALDITLGSIWRGNYVKTGVQNNDQDDKNSFLRQLRADVQAEIDNYFTSGYFNLDFNEPFEL